MHCRRIAFLGRNYSTKGINNHQLDYDIVISGGGMIGSTLACVLSRNPLLSTQKILLIEGAKKKNWSLGKTYSNRVSALNPSTRRLLETVGIWNHIKELRFKPVKQMKVWGSSSNATIEFGNDNTLVSNNSSDDVAYIVENDVLLAAVDKELQKSEGTVTVIHGSKVQNYVMPTSGCKNEPVSLVMDDGKTYKCSLLLGTDGANSKVRKTMGVDYINWNYNQSAVVATLQLEKIPSNQIAWQRFLPTGPIALLPLNDEISSLVWSTTTSKAKELLLMTNEEFVNALNNALVAPPQRNSVVEMTSQFIDLTCRSLNKAAISKVVSPSIPPVVKAVDEGSRASFPLGFGHASSYVMPGVALLGDSAHRVHPLAGQGVNLGFGDIATLNRLLTEAVTNGDVISSYLTLKQYEKERLRHNLPTMLAVDVINKVYSNSNTAMMAFGHFAIQIANSVSPLKGLMMRQASS